MKAQFDNEVMSSFFLWFDHTLLEEGEAYTNYGWKFYDVDDVYQGYHTYGAPFRQFVSDASIGGATVMNEVYLDGVVQPRGQSNFTGINYSMGQVYFDADVDASAVEISGNYAVKDFDVFLTNQLEEKLLFETQYNTSNKTTISPTGLPTSSKTFPCVFLKNNGTINEPFAFGGEDLTTVDVRAIVLSDSQFSLDAVSSIFRDEARGFVPLIPESDQPFNNLGDFKDANTPYNYNNLTSTSLGQGNSVYIKEVSVSKVGGLSYAQMSNLNPNVYSAIIDFELEKPRMPRT